MGKVAFVFQGQGAQYPGMGKELCKISKAALEIFKKADRIRPETSSQCFGISDENLTDTAVAQPCIFTTDLAAAAMLVEKGIQPEGVAGFSLGEMAALTFSGVMSFEDGLKLVINRGKYMKESSDIEGAMVAILKLSKEDVEGIAAEYKVYPVNYNCPGQIVVAGEKSEIKKFAKAVKAAKGVTVPLKVSGAFHTPYMKNAGEKLKLFMNNLNISPPRIPVYSNYNAAIYGNEKDNIVTNVALQCQSPVLWQQTIENMIEEGFDTFYQVGPGDTLVSMIKKINSSVIAVKVEKEEDLENVKK